jgi:hypothetical protein
MVFAKSYLPFLPFTERLVTKFVKHTSLSVKGKNGKYDFANTMKKS